MQFLWACVVSTTETVREIAKKKCITSITRYPVMQNRHVSVLCRQLDQFNEQLLSFHPAQPWRKRGTEICFNEDELFQFMANVRDDIISYPYGGFYHNFHALQAVCRFTHLPSPLTMAHARKVSAADSFVKLSSQPTLRYCKTSSWRDVMRSLHLQFSDRCFSMKNDALLCIHRILSVGFVVIQ